jgi:capsular polysaccharide export protein
VTSPPTPVPFLRVPPFPGSRVRAFRRLPEVADAPVSIGDCVALLRAGRVGGDFWSAQPELPPAYTLVRSPTAVGPAQRIVEEHGPSLTWLANAAHAEPGIHAVTGECDPWHMLGGARALVCDADDEVRLVAAILGVPTYVSDPAGGAPQRRDGDSARLLSDSLPLAALFANPFGGKPLTLAGIIELAAFWRSLIDSNRAIGSGVGFAFWKQDSVLPLLWGGGDSSSFFRGPARGDARMVAVWRSQAAPDAIEQLERQGIPLVEVEDGFLRSAGLGADCVPPLSITVDRLGPYFDPGQPSEIEEVLENGQFDLALVGRARRLRETIVAAGLGKYEQGNAPLERYGGARRHILVPGQVEDDRSILTGGAGLVSNLELLERVRKRAPDAFIVYKPHPDVVAGHRKGYIPEQIARRFADKVVTDAPISSLIAMADEVHVNTSLAGFEALMRHKDVTTHGVPFYAGWGLTRDLGPVPARRTARRSLDELVAATLLLYPRYLDPVSGLPCPAETVVDRLTAQGRPPAGPLVRLRRLQGRLRRRLTAWRAA